MRTVDYPLSRDAPGVVGHFALISLDPVASVAPLNDDTATHEAAGLTPGRYLAFVKNYADFQWTDSGPRLTLHFTLCGRGLPSPPDSWAAIPIAPAQPTGTGGCTRPAVEPVVPMPLAWDDCYIYTLHFIAGNVSRIVLGDDEHPAPRLSEDGQRQVFIAAFEDQRTQGMAERMRDAEMNQAQSDHDSLAQAESVQDELSQNSPRLQEPASSAADELQEADIEDDGTDEQALFAELFQQDDTPRMKLRFQVSLDFSACSPDQLSNPAHLEAELVQLERIEWDWAQRIVSSIISKEPETSAWLAGIGDADVPPVTDSESIEVSREDELVMPEDAIEHRMERGELTPALSNVNRAAGEDGSAARGALKSASTTGTGDSAETESLASSADTAKGSKHLSGSGSSSLSVFRTLLSSISSFVSRIRGFFWSFLWSQPFPKT